MKVFTTVESRPAGNEEFQRAPSVSVTRSLLFSTQVLINLRFDQRCWLHAANMQFYVRTAAVTQDFHVEIKARGPADGPEPRTSTRGGIYARTCMWCSYAQYVFTSATWRRPFRPSAVPAVPAVKEARTEYPTGHLTPRLGP